MSPKECGQFIAFLRKEKNLTQKQLADELNVSDKAVSRWETGKGFPDIDLLVSLSEFFNVSVNELLSGKRIEKEQFTQFAENNVIDAMQSKKQEMKKKKTQMIVISILFSILLIPTLIPTIIYFLDSGMKVISFENITEFVVLLTVGGLIILVGFAVFKGNISLMHSYHYKNVVDKMGYCKSIGKTTMLMGIPVIISSFTTLFPSVRIIEAAGSVILIAGLVIGCAYIFKYQYKYNGGLF